MFAVFRLLSFEVFAKKMFASSLLCGVIFASVLMDAIQCINLFFVLNINVHFSALPRS